MKQLAAIIALFVATAPGLASGQRAPKPPKKPAPACGITYLPLQPGNTWTYKAGATEVVVTVVGVAPGKGADGKPRTEIQVEEAIGEKKATATWTCTAAEGLTLPPTSILFAGEAGGGTNLTLVNPVTTGPTLVPDAQIIEGFQWTHTLKADADRPAAPNTGAKHAPAKVEIELVQTVATPEDVTTAMGDFTALKIGFELRGRGIVGEEKAEIPVKRPGAFYYVKGVGVVKIEDAFDRVWDLSATNMPLP